MLPIKNRERIKDLEKRLDRLEKLVNSLKQKVM